MYKERAFVGWDHDNAGSVRRVRPVDVAFGVVVPLIALITDWLWYATRSFTNTSTVETTRLLRYAGVSDPQLLQSWQPVDYTMSLVGIVLIAVWFAAGARLPLALQNVMAGIFIGRGIFSLLLGGMIIQGVIVVIFASPITCLLSLLCIAPFPIAATFLGTAWRIVKQSKHSPLQALGGVVFGLLLFAFIPFMGALLLGI
jgi:hypothetical protein